MLPFTDVTVRANTSAEIWWSLSGTPSFDEHGRFLGFRGIGTDLTEKRKSDAEISRLARGAVRQYIEQHAHRGRRPRLYDEPQG